jgi:hypothetical protein
MSDEIKIAVYLGTGNRGRKRLAALRAMAAEGGHYWDGDPSPGRLIAAQIDQWLAYQEEKASEAQREAD